MVVATDRDDSGDRSTSVWIVKRNADGSFTDDSKREVLAAYKQCNTVAVHPVNGELYFNRCTHCPWSKHGWHGQQYSERFFHRARILVEHARSHPLSRQYEA